MKLWERIFRRKELKKLQSSNALLIKMNQNILQMAEELAESNVVLDRQERIVLLECLNDPHFKDRVKEPKTPRLVRMKYAGLKVKILAGMDGSPTEQ